MGEYTISAAKEVGDLFFYSIKYHGRPLELTLTGKLASGLRTFDDVHSVYVELDKPELVTVLDELNWTNFTDMGIEPRSPVNEHNEISVKLKMVADKWVFNSNTVVNETSLVMGAPVTLTVRPGFYANEKTTQGGLFLTLKTLNFDEAAPKKRRVKI